MKSSLPAFIFLFTLYTCSVGFAEPNKSLTIAVATNFLTTAQELGNKYEELSEVEVTLVSGSSGNLFAQIKNGAPYDVFLSADEAKIDASIELELGIEDTRITYALGRLCFVLNPNLDQEHLPQYSLEILNFKRIVLANPKVAPYGTAAGEVFEKFNIDLAYEKKKVILADNVGKTYAIVRSGNADAGMVALSSVLDDELSSDYYYVIPEKLHSPIRQDAIILDRTSHRDLAQEFLEFLQSSDAHSIIKTNGYTLD